MRFTRTQVVVGGIVIFLIAMGVAGFFIFKKSQRVESFPAVLRQLPDLVFKDINGNSIAVSSLRGRPVVLDVWASWCSLCTSHIFQFGALQKEFGDKLVIVEVNRGESVEIIKKYADANSTGGSLLFFLDADDSLYKAVNGFSMPESIFVDKDGNIADHTRGPMDITEMRRRIQDSFDL